MQDVLKRNLVRAMGGELSAESVPGEGSIFTIDLALAKAEAEGSSSQPA